MVNKQNPFSLYDFLGYLIPGALLIYAFLIIRFINRASKFDVDLLIENLSRVKLENIFPFIIAAYALGHILSYASSITIESYANWKYGYPSKYLLQSQKDRKDKKKSRHSYWKKFKNNENKRHNFIQLLALHFNYCATTLFLL